MYYISNNRPFKILNTNDIEICNNIKYYSSCSNIYGYHKFIVYDSIEQAWDYIIEQCDKSIQSAVDYKNYMLKMKESDLNYEF
jgi:hypothetical protein